MKRSFYGDGDLCRVVAAGTGGSGEAYRSDFRRDYARIIHSPAFRRLQRKTQLFPGEESDFFRNRLTHSLEVAQIAKSIAIRLNHLIEERHGGKFGSIDLDAVEVAGLAHDLGHPPFGHTGEHALNEQMYSCGGFEGNAQTLRIVARLEKRQTLGIGGSQHNGTDFTEFWQGSDLRCGLNLTYRSLASILKYDEEIPLIGRDQKLVKGYYYSEKVLVEDIKRNVLGEDWRSLGKLKVVEMQIMDIADDIAYSTYDFEDALKAGFGSPIDLLQQMNNNEELRNEVAEKLFKSQTGRKFSSNQTSPQDREIFDDIQGRMSLAVVDMLMTYLVEIDEQYSPAQRALFLKSNQRDRAQFIAAAAVTMQKLSDQIAKNGYVRSQFTSDLIGKRIRSIDIEVNEEVPCVSEVKISPETRFEIDVLKHLTFGLHINSPRLKLIEYRGKQIVHELFESFDKDKEGELLPADWRGRLRSIRDFASFEEMRKRIICDYIAGMTDSYALDVYSRLKTTNPSALFRPT